MYRSRVVSLLSKLSRMGSMAPSGPAPSEENRPSAHLDALRAKMQAILARTALREPPPPRAVDTTELPFLTHETPAGPLHERTMRLSAAHRTGHAPLLPARDACRELLALLALDPVLAGCDPSRALYLDTETTGLHGGAGTVAFLVGLAYWDAAPGASGGLIVEQLLVRALGEEAPMLERVAARIRDASMLITFNGKSFDMPLLRTRFVMAKMEPPIEPPHLDLMHVARRVHKRRGEGPRRGWSCRLTALERDVLGFERIDDVPSGEVSACYLHFLRTGEASALLGVVEHNAWDVVAMAALVGLYGEPLGTSRLATDDLVGLARTLKRAGDLTRAEGAANEAVSRCEGRVMFQAPPGRGQHLGEDNELAMDSLRVRAEIAKARGDRERALLDFEAIAAGADCARARLELAKLYEHYVREPARALALVERGTGEGDDLTSKRAARLARKVERAQQTKLVKR